MELPRQSAMVKYSNTFFVLLVMHACGGCIVSTGLFHLIVDTDKHISASKRVAYWHFYKNETGKLVFGLSQTTYCWKEIMLISMLIYVSL